MSQHIDVAYIEDCTCGKRGYATWKQADVVAKKMNTREGSEYEYYAPYFAKSCGQIHIGSSMKNQSGYRAVERRSMRSRLRDEVDNTSVRRSKGSPRGLSFANVY